MVVFVIGRGVPTREAPTNGIFEYNQALAISETGIKVYYLYADIRSFRHKRKFGLSHVHSGNLEIIGYSIPGGRMPMNARIMLRKIGYWRLFRYCNRHSIIPDIIHAHFLEAISAVVSLKRFYSAPIIGTEHFSLVLEEGSRKEEIIKRNTYAGVDSLISVSPYLGSVLKEKYGVESTYIPNLINDEVFNFTSKKREYDFLCVGDLNVNKNFRGVLEAFTRCFSEQDNVTLNIVGVGPLEIEFKEYIRKNNREKQIHLLGFQPNEVVAELMKNTKTLISNSYKETFGVVCVEAVMCGAQVISTRCGGPECFINDLNGILINTGNVEELSAIMRHVYENSLSYEQRVKNATVAIKHFSKKTIIHDLIQMYDDFSQLSED